MRGEIAYNTNFAIKNAVIWTLFYFQYILHVSKSVMMAIQRLVNCCQLNLELSPVKIRHRSFNDDIFFLYFRIRVER